MTFDHEQITPGPEPMLTLRAEDGAWYKLPAADLERARITDTATLDEVRGYLAAAGLSAITLAGDEGPIVLLDETLAPYRVGEARAAELEAAGDVAGFGDPIRQNDSPGPWWSIGPFGVWKMERVPGEHPNTFKLSQTVAFQAMPSLRFGGGTPYVR